MSSLKNETAIDIDPTLNSNNAMHSISNSAIRVHTDIMPLYLLSCENGTLTLFLDETSSVVGIHKSLTVVISGGAIRH